MTQSPTAPTVLVTAAGGYLGGLVVAELLRRGRGVRVLVRSPDRLADRPWRDDVDVVTGDLGDARAVAGALDGIEVAYYLVHSMDGGDDFAARDRRLATIFADAARQARLRRIVYLSGLHPDGELSPHLASRVEVGEILLASGVPTAVLQAAVVLGDGSASFDMLRHLTTRLPAMVAPKWLHNRIQPIGVDDVVHDLVAAADLPAEVNRTFDVGGPDVMTYAQMMQRFAEVTGLRRRLIVTVPVLTPRLASHWIGVVTPVDTGVATPLVDSLVHEVVCREDDLHRYVGEPPGGATGFDEAVRRAMTGADPDPGPRMLAATGAAVAATAALGVLATRPDDPWYLDLDKPAWQPPGWAFGAVWTPLYVALAASTASAQTELARRGDEEQLRDLRVALAANLALNACWSWLFWRSKRLDVAAVEAALLAISSTDLARRAAAVSPARGAALAPYAGWTVFATALSTAIHRRNRGRS